MGEVTVPPVLVVSKQVAASYSCSSTRENDVIASETIQVESSSASAPQSDYLRNVGVTGARAHEVWVQGRMWSAFFAELICRRRLELNSL